MTIIKKATNIIKEVNDDFNEIAENVFETKTELNRIDGMKEGMENFFGLKDEKPKKPLF